MNRVEVSGETVWSGKTVECYRCRSHVRTETTWYLDPGSFVCKGDCVAPGIKPAGKCEIPGCCARVLGMRRRCPAHTELVEGLGLTAEQLRNQAMRDQAMQQREAQQGMALQRQHDQEAAEAERMQPWVDNIAQAAALKLLRAELEATKAKLAEAERELDASKRGWLAAEEQLHDARAAIRRDVEAECDAHALMADMRGAHEHEMAGARQRISDLESELGPTRVKALDARLARRAK